MVWSGISVTTGGSLSEDTLMVNASVALKSTPPFSVPPSSLKLTNTVALPLSLAAGV